MHRARYLAVCVSFLLVGSMGARASRAEDPPLSTGGSDGTQLLYNGMVLVRASHRRPLVADALKSLSYGWAIEVKTALKTNSIIAAVVSNDDPLRPLEIVRVEGDALDSFLLAPIRGEDLFCTTLPAGERLPGGCPQLVAFPRLDIEVFASVPAVATSIVNTRDIPAGARPGRVQLLFPPSNPAEVPDPFLRVSTPRIRKLATDTVFLFTSQGSQVISAVRSLSIPLDGGDDYFFPAPGHFFTRFVFWNRDIGAEETWLRMNRRKTRAAYLVSHLRYTPLYVRHDFLDARNGLR